MVIKILVTLFVLFAVSRVVLRYRDGSIGTLAMVGWGCVWLGVEAFVWWPKVSDILARSIGIGRGLDALVTISVVVLFYSVFRIYIKLEFIEHELTSLVRALALKTNADDGQQKEEGADHR